MSTPKEIKNLMRTAKRMKATDISELSPNDPYCQRLADITCPAYAQLEQMLRQAADLLFEEADRKEPRKDCNCWHCRAYRLVEQINGPQQ